MAKLIGISQAAKELGITRSVLCRRLRSAGVPTFEGKVDVEQLRQVTPQWDLRESTAAADAARIQDAAMMVRRLGAMRPLARDPEAELRKVAKELVLARGKVEHLEKVCEDLIGQLDALQSSTDPACRDLALDLSKWLVERLKGW